MLDRSQETIYRFLNSGNTIEQYLKTYQRNKRRCGRKRSQLPKAEIDYIHLRIKAGWTPDTIIGRSERLISCSMRTLYRMFARGQYNFDVQSLPMKGKRHPNGYIERRGKAGALVVVFTNDITTFLITNMNLGTLKLIRFKVKLIAEQ